jgi:hypothetical protein
MSLTPSVINKATLRGLNLGLLIAGIIIIRKVEQQEIVSIARKVFLAM